LTTPPTTTTSTSSPAPKLPPASRKRRHTLPGQPTTPQLSTQPLCLHPELPAATDTLQPQTPTLPATTTSEMAPNVSSSAHTATTTMEPHKRTVNYVQGPSTAQQTALHDYTRTRSLERVICRADDFCWPHHLQPLPMHPPAPPCPPKLAPQTPVTQHKPTSMPHTSTRPATSSTTCLSMMTIPPALPHSVPRTAAPEQRDTHLDTAEHARNTSQPHRSPPTPQKRAVSPPPVWYTPPASPTTPSSPANTPRPPPMPCPPHICPSSAQFSPKRAVWPTPAHFDWAKDAASLPTAPSSRSQDISSLKTGRPQPFGTLRQRTRRRRTPPQFFQSSQQYFHLVRPSFVQSQGFITRRHPSGIGPGKPVVIAPFGGPPAPVPPILNLDWDQDPRLMSLSQALCALGWVPPC
jgi:hypothetical protein